MPPTSASLVVGHLAAVLCLAALGNPSPTQATAQDTVPVVGQVRAEGDRAISTRANVLVKTRDGRLVTKRLADREGRFEIRNLSRSQGPYRLTVEAFGYNSAQQDLDLSDASGAVTVRVVLTPAAGTRQAAPDLPALSDMRVSRKARKAFKQGVRALKAHNLPEAQRYLSEAVAKFPCFARAQTLLATVLVARADLEGAEAVVRKAVQCDAGFPGGFAWLARILNSENRFKESETILRRGLRVSPKSWELYEQLAGAHYGMGSFSQARDEWLYVMDLNPKAPTRLHAKLAAAYLQEHDYERSYAEMQVYLRAEPQGRFAAWITSAMQQLESSRAVHPRRAATPQSKLSQP